MLKPTSANVSFPPIADISGFGDAASAMRHVIVFFLLFVAACTRQVEVSAVQPSKDFSGLSNDDRAERPDWAAFAVIVPAGVARSIRRWELSNVTLQVFRCGNPDDAYPAAATLNGKPFQYEDLAEPLPASTRLTFYVPLETAGSAVNACAAMDAKGYSPVFLRSQTVRLPPMRMTFPHYDEKTGRITSS